MEIAEETGSEAYATLLHHLATSSTARRVAPRGLPTYEDLNVTLRITDPGEVHVLRTRRRPNLRIAATEAMHLVGGISSLDQLDRASGGRFKRFANDGRLLGAYGPRAHRQLLAVERLLKRDPNTRQAVVSLWTGGEHDVTSRDVPCTTTMQFFIRGGALHLRVTMRSNDAWLGLPYDLMMFSCLQRTMACALSIDPGEYTHSVGSMHLYERDLDAAYHILDGDVDARIADHAMVVNVGIPVPLFHIANRSFADLSDNAVATCFNQLPSWGSINADQLSHYGPPLDPNVDTLCLTCRYVTAGDVCDTRPTDD